MKNSKCSNCPKNSWYKYLLYGFFFISTLEANSTPQLHITADKLIKLSQKNNTTLLIAEGKVHVKYKNFLLEAEKVIYNGTHVIALGKVKFERGNSTQIFANKIISTVNQTDIVAWEPYGYIEPYYFKAQSLNKKGEIFTAIKGCFSECEDYQAQICAQKAQYNRTSGIVSALGVKLLIENKTLFYLPKYQIVTKRKTGFLSPKLGIDSYGGFVYQQPFFLVIDRSTDMTFTSDLRTEGLYGFWTEFRKYFSRKFYWENEFQIYKDYAEGKAWWEGRDYYKENRYLLRGKGFYGKLKFGWSYPSDSDYFYDIYIFEKKLRYLSFTRSYLSYVYENKDWIIGLRSEYFYDLTNQTRENDLILLPDALVYLKTHKLTNYAEYSGWLSITNFQQEKGSLQRYYFRPTLKIRKIIANKGVNFYIEPYAVFYKGNLVDENNYSSSAEGIKLTAKAMLYSLRMLKEGNLQWFSYWQGIYTFDPFNNKDLPTYDNFDEIYQQNQIEIQTLNNFYWKDYRVIKWIIRQPYNFYNGYSLPTSGEFIEGHLLPLKSYLTITPNEKFTFKDTLYYDYQLNSIIYQSLSSKVKLNDKWEISLGYSYSKNAEGEKESDQYKAKFKYAFKKLESKFQIYYDNIEEKPVRSELDLSYVKKCWKLTFSIERNYNEDSEKYEWQAFITLTVFHRSIDFFLGGQ